jgi:hypothetical protein
MRRWSSFALGGICVLSASLAEARPSVLVVASDPARIREIDAAKIVASDASWWLSVRLSGSAKLAVVVSEADLEPAPAADDWLRALDFSTRVRVTPPPGPLASCSDVTGDLADSGVPEPASLGASSVSSALSELALRRSLESADFALELPLADRFSAGSSAPYRIALFEAGASGGSTAAMRLHAAGPALSVPGIAVAGREGVPLSLLALAPRAVLPDVSPLFDPSDFPIKYRGTTASTDYVAARASWLALDPSRWLVEARASSALFARTVIPGAGEIEPAVSLYFQHAAGVRDGRGCFNAAEAARMAGSRDATRYGCGKADDLARSLSELDFGDARVTRVFGSTDVDGIALRSSSDGELGARVVATDFDARDCPAAVTVTPGSDGTTQTGSSYPAPAVPSGGMSVDPSSEASGSASSEGCQVTVFTDSCSGDSSGSSSADSCSGDSSSSDSCSGSSDSSSSDSCSGSSDSSSSDSCSGSSDSSSSDSCSGDSSDSTSDDSSGCGNSNYDGDTCSGSFSSSAAPQSKSAALEPARAHARRPRRIHLSLITLLAALIAAPLRRKKSRRLFPHP